MLNLDAISRNLFGTGSISSRSQSHSMSGSDIIGTSSTRRSKFALSRTSTMDTNSRMSAETHLSATEGVQCWTSSITSRQSELIEKLSPMSTPYGGVSGKGFGESEVELDERLHLARKNSKSMAALGAKPSGARPLGSKNVAELQEGVDNRQGPDNVGSCMSGSGECLNIMSN